MSEEVKDTGAETATEETTKDAGRLPWFPATTVFDDDDKQTIRPIKEAFKTQAECDAWIKDNISEDVIVVSLRLGRRFKVTRRVVEL